MIKDALADLTAEDGGRLVKKAATWTLVSVALSAGISYGAYSVFAPRYFDDRLAVLLPLICPALIAFPITMIIEALSIRLDRQSRHLVEKNQALELALTDLEAANLQKRAFLSGASHELRTPLTSILGYSDLMLAGKQSSLSDSDASYIRMIHSSGEHLQRIIEDFMDIARVEEGRLDLRLEPVDLRMAVERATRLCERDLRAGEVSVSIEAGLDGTIVYCDETRLTQIMVNLIANAAKYAGEGSALIISTAIEDEMVHVAIHDDGAGMNDADLEVALSDFGRTGDAMRSGKIGFGLGLPLVRRLAEALGGRFAIESAPGEGTRVTIQLPAGDAAD